MIKKIKTNAIIQIIFPIFRIFNIHHQAEPIAYISCYYENCNHK